MLSISMRSLRRGGWRAKTRLGDALLDGRSSARFICAVDGKIYGQQPTTISFDVVLLQDQVGTWQEFDALRPVFDDRSGLWVI